jgi:pSer/pThr/pTyr-binding forkhead associated (FHA) protein
VGRPGQAALQDVTTGAVYRLEWQPARLGRRDVDAVHNELLLVNLEWHPDGQRVSRQHAQITERQSVYYLESLTPRNPTLLNGRPLPPGETARLRSGDMFRLGHSELVMKFVLNGQ